MAKLKMKKLPKAPKKTASVEAKERYLQRVKEIQKENAQRAALNRKSEELSKKIAKVVSCFKK